MIKFFIQILIAVLVFLTLIVSVKKPALNKTLFIYDSNLIIDDVAEENEPAEINIIPAKKQIQKQADYKITEYKAQKEKPSYKVVEHNIQKEVQKERPLPLETTKVKKIEVLNNVKNISKKTAPINTKTTTTQSELVEWNIWRSNIQNQIMQDTKLPFVPMGTVFKFSFDVDKFGKISNIKTYSTTPNYTPYAIQYIAPVIRSYQGREILNFPKGSIRYQTTVQGGWKISDNQKLSSPSDFYDLEKIRK